MYAFSMRLRPLIVLIIGLSDRKIPTCWIRILMVWYRSQNVYVQWGALMAIGFTGSNGVRQGGHHGCQLFFRVYLDDLSKELKCWVMYVGSVDKSSLLC